MCRRFFAQFPNLESFLASPQSQFQSARNIVRVGQVPFIQSAAEVMLENAREVPQDLPTLLRIRGIGAKVAECVIGYGWGKEALPVDAHVCRVLVRISGPPEGHRHQLESSVREQLKGLFTLHQRRLASVQISMIDLHELLRLHGQTICTRVPKCWQCPLAQCLYRQDEYQAPNKPVVNSYRWEDWCELLLDPSYGNMRATSKG